ncbi:helix-turn-helix domain-containing protein [Confluentibacter flavum]|uniref:AraC family transcriptional regulator n=1 Tax=Confluentibacter flavum TaxID=1909700 RepID=A0A2N3HI15_9FLAO|nr:helix-turn-helix domain-containing protein [Confluentibacter flavum]PKQ44532.1 AraC family transcriptional regulator [Confluentibacter flavum]
MKPILQFKGLYGDNQSSYLSEFIHFEPLEFRSKIYSWEINQHVHSELFQIFIIKSGNGTLVSGKNKITINSPSVITIPASIMHGFSFDPNVEGDVLTFSDSYIENVLKENPQLYLKLNKINQFFFVEETTHFNNLLYLVKNISNEILNEAIERQLALKSYFQLLFLELYRKGLIVDNLELQTSNRTLLYFQQFQKLIKQSMRSPLTIEEYALKLGITQMHLNRVCHAVVGESALKVVQSFMINEAKKYLLNTSYSISEIAYFLNFNDPAYFSRLFKKLVGVPPGEFRKS